MSHFVLFKLREIALLILILIGLAILAGLLSSCSSQVVTTPGGQTVVNNNFLSKGTLSVGADGAILMAGDAEKAAEELGRYGKVYLQWKAAPTVIDAATSGISGVTKTFQTP